MSGDPATTRPATPAPTPNDGLTDAERGYFESGGMKTDGLVPDPSPAPGAMPGAPAPAATPAATPGAPAASPGAPAATPPTDPNTQVTDAAGRTVPLATLLSERERRQAAERTISEKDQTLARLDERIKLINEALGGPAQPGGAPVPAEDPEPDPQTDIFAYVAWQGRQLKRAHEQITELGTTFSDQQAETTLKTNYINDINRYVRTPEGSHFAAAYQHLVNARGNQLQAIGHTDPAKINEMIAREERNLVKQAIENNKSPAQVLYAVAQSFGFIAPAASPAPGAAPPAAPAAAAPAAPAAPAATPTLAQVAAGAPANGGAAPAAAAPGTAAAEIAAIAAAQPMAMSLSIAGGQGGATLTPQMLADMPQDQFEQLLARLSPSAQKALLSGQGLTT